MQLAASSRASLALARTRTAAPVRPALRATPNLRSRTAVKVRAG
jgi:hypothetical protein